MKRIILCLLACYNLLSFAEEKVLNIYNWADYMPRTIIQQFEKETGITVHYVEYESNEVLYARLKADPHIGYDIVFPSNYYVQRMAHEHMLAPLDYTRIPNWHYIRPTLLHKAYDPHNTYNLPYLWGTTAIALNNHYYHAKDFQHWNALWNPSYRHQLMLLDDSREVFSMALISLGYSVNDKNPKHIHQAYLKLKALLPNVKIISVDNAINLFVDEDMTLGMGFSGYVYLMQQENSDVEYVYPKDHVVLWIDCVSILANAPHPDNSHRFINFINRPDIAAKIAIYTGLSTPNAAALPLLPSNMRTSPILNPPLDVLKRTEMENDLGAIDAIYEHYWELLKLG